MGAWQGIGQGLAAVDERKFRNRQLALAEDKFTESRRQTRLELLLRYGEDSKKSTTSAKSKATEAKRLMSIGLPEEVALFLSASGEGTELLKQYDKVAVDKRARNFISNLTKRVQNYLGDEANAENVAKAFKASILSGEDLSDPEGQEKSLIQSIYAAQTTEDFADVDEQLVEIINTAREDATTISIDPLGIAYSGMAAIPATRIKQIEGELLKRVSPSFGEFFKGTDPDGNPILNPEVIVGGVDADTFRNYVDQGLQSVTAGLQSLDPNSNLTENELIQNAADAITSYAPQVSDPTVIENETESLNPPSVMPTSTTTPPNSPTSVETFQERLKRIAEENKSGG